MQQGEASKEENKDTNVLRCVVPECSWTYPCSYSSQECMELIKMHMEYCHRSGAPVATSGTKAPKFDAPTIDAGLDEEAWVSFTLRWKQYCRGTNISRDLQSLQLFQCATESLGNLLLKSNPNITDCPPELVLQELRRLAVIPKAKLVSRAELMKMKQDNDELFRTFAARVQGKASVCGFSVKKSCECGKESHTDYTEEVIKDVIVAGIGDEALRTSVLETEGLEDKSLNDIIAIIERKERARKAYRPSAVSALSSFKRQGNNPVQFKSSTRVLPAESPKTPCPRCKKPFQKFNGKNMKAFEVCLNCFRKAKSRRGNRMQTAAAISLGEDDVALLQQPNVDGKASVSVNSVQAEKEHPRIAVQISPVNHRNIVSVMGIADTGAQPDLWGLDGFLKSGLNRSILKQTDVDVRVANKQSLDIVGSFLAEFIGKAPDGRVIKHQSMIFITSSLSDLYVSKDTLIGLGAIDLTFPTIGSCNSIVVGEFQVNSINTETPHDVSTRFLNQGCMTGSEDSSQCCCPQRSAVPLRPKTLPIEPIAQNNGAMRDWLLSYFGSSTFNTCPHRPLQEMAGPPLSIHVSDDAIPRVCHTPAQIPLHWQERVYADIKRDESLGILEKVPYGEPVTWCHRLVVTRKHDGSPRRTVDLSPLNKFCSRETHGSESPYHLARRVPQNTWKTVTDAWNGYHSVPLRESDRHLTTFITPFGRWRYTRAPQGYLSSGDGYNRRFQAILEDFPRKERCVDDTLHFDENLEEHYWRTIDFLIMVGQAGVVLNPDKFQFAQKDVEFAGFRIMSDTVEPLPKYFEAIKSFPTPRNVTDIKSWFGLVNQVSSYAQLRDTMAPFRKFLSPKTKFEWDSSLDIAFEKSKAAIIDSIKHGVQIFDVKKPTCLRTDWSVKGIGHFLLQKHCSCSNDLPNCCSDGWKTTLAGSRFLSDTESRYAAIEGEALGVAWGLEQTKYFTQGCDNLLVVVDHKPLVKLFEDRTLDEIANTRIFRLKQRTLPWKFSMAYLPGNTNAAADAASRNPSVILSTAGLSFGDITEQLTAAAISRETSDFTAIDWSTIVRETSNDLVLCELKKAIEEDYAGKYTMISDFHRYRESLFIQDGAVMYQDRVVVPEVLRPAVLDSLHAAHQGVSAMLLRAQAIIFWPGISLDITRTREKCNECNRNAPSQASLPSEPADCPTTPFQHVFADFLSFGGRSYLVAGDRLSGFSELFFTPTGTSNSGARGLIACLRKWFQTFGVPEELSSDGGPEFTADSTRVFLKKWGVRHRISSAYHAKSNGRAEVAVKTVKRLMRSNISPSGSLNTDCFLRAMLQLRNTPDPDCGVSAAEIVFGRPMRDNLQFSSYITRSSYSDRWQQAWSAKEDALKARFVKTSEKINAHARPLPPLVPGDRCFIQNQAGNFKKKWYQSGTVIETQPFDKYLVKVDGSGRTTARNRQYLRKFIPYSTSISDSGISEANDKPMENAPIANKSPNLPDHTNGWSRNETHGGTLLVGGDETHGDTLLVGGDETHDDSLLVRGEAHTPSPNMINEVPRSSNPTGCDYRHSSAKPKRLPLCLRRLLPHNQPGISE